MRTRRIAFALTVGALATGGALLASPASAATGSAVAPASVGVAETRYCPYTTAHVNPGNNLNIRSGPGTQYSIVGKWPAGQVRMLPEPYRSANGFREIASSQWVSQQHIKRTTGLCETP